MAVFFTGVSGAAYWMLLGFAVVPAALGVLGTWWGPGAISRGERAPQLAQAGLGCLVLGVLALLMLWWRPAVGQGLPGMLPGLLLLMAAGGLFIPVGLMGDDRTELR